MIVKIRSIEQNNKPVYSVFVDTNHVISWAIKYPNGLFSQINLFLSSGKVMSFDTDHWSDSDLGNLITALSQKQKLANKPQKDKLND